MEFDRRKGASPLDLLRRGVSELGGSLTPSQVAQFDRYLADLIEWNTRFNLTAITDPDAIVVKHFLDSLTLVPTIEELLAGPGVLRLVDVGAGAGFPGLPIAIAVPRTQVTLVEATGKKCRFLEHIIGALALPNVEVRCGRSEDLARDAKLRGKFDAVVARALATLATLVELTLPFARVGGRVIAMKKVGIEAEIAEAAFAVKALGGTLRPSVTVRLPVLEEARQMVVVEKVQATPSEYPRRPGLPGKSPLGAPRTGR